MKRYGIKILNPKHDIVTQELLFEYGFTWSGRHKKYMNVYRENRDKYVWLNHESSSGNYNLMYGSKTGDNEKDYTYLSLKELKEKLEKDLIKWKIKCILILTALKMPKP